MSTTEFSQPGSQLRAVHLWMLNDVLDPESMRRQIRLLAQGGCGAIITRTYYGLRTSYLSDDYLACMEATIDEAQQWGLEVYLQAGYMPNGVPGLTENVCGRGLMAYPVADALPRQVEPVTTDDKYHYCVHRFEHAIDLLSPDAVAAYVELAYESPWRRFADQFGKTIKSIWVDEPSFRPPMLPWSPKLPAVFQKSWGYDLLPHVPQLFRRQGDYISVRHHYWRTVVEMLASGYFATIADWCSAHDLEFSGHLMGEETLADQIALTGATMPLYEYMHLPGIDHLSSSLNWTHGAAGGEGGVKCILAPKQCTSVANQMGRPRALAEMYGVSTQALTFVDQKRIGEFLALLGINQRCLHASFFSMRGRRKRLHAPNLSYQQPWWQHNPCMADYFARLSYLLRQGHYAANVAIIHPVESAFACFDPLLYHRSLHKRSPMPDIERMNSHLVELCENLLDIGCQFELVDETILARHGRATPDGQLDVGKMSYQAVILPELLTIRSSTLRLLQQFAESGGTILSTASVPRRIDGTEDTAADRLATLVRRVQNVPNDLQTNLNAVLATTTRIEKDPRVWLHRRRVDSGELLFLANTDNGASHHVRLHVPLTHSCERWDLEDGTVGKLSPTRGDNQTKMIDVELEPWQSCALLVRSETSSAPIIATQSPTKKAVELSECWRLARHSPNALVLDTCRLHYPGQERALPPLPVLAAQDLLTAEGYQGPVTLTFEFDIHDMPEQLALVVEDAKRWQILTNSKPCSCEDEGYYIDPSFHPVDIRHAAKPGRNSVELHGEFAPLKKTSFSLSALFENIDGVELENTYLIGDFAIKAEHSPRTPRPGCISLSPGFALVREPQHVNTDLILAGYPFFSGTITLAQSVNLRQLPPDTTAVFRIGDLNACAATLRVNGHDVGSRCLPPFEWDITQLVREGHNALELDLTNTLRNLLGPHHRPSGEPDSCWGEGAFKGYAHASPANIGQWLAEINQESSTWTNDYFCVPFGAARTQITLHQT